MRAGCYFKAERCANAPAWQLTHITREGAHSRRWVCEEHRNAVIDDLPEGARTSYTIEPWDHVEGRMAPV